MMAVARGLISDTELCSDGPALMVCTDAQAEALMRGGAEAMQQVAKAEATVLLMRAQASKKIEKPIAKKKAPVIRTFMGPDGEYQLQEPKNFN